MALRGCSSTLGDHSDQAVKFSRRYWPGGAIVGLMLGWVLAAIGYSNSQNNVVEAGTGRDLRLPTKRAEAA